MGAVRDFFSWKQQQLQEENRQSSDLLVTLASLVPPELGQWWQKKGLSWLQEILHEDRTAIWFSRCKESELGSYVFDSLDDAQRKLSLLKLAWSEIFDMFEINVRILGHETELSVSLRPI